MSDALLAVKAAHATVVFSQLLTAAATSNTDPKFQRRSPNLGGDCRQADASVYEVCHREGRSAFAPRLPGCPDRTRGSQLGRSLQQSGSRRGYLHRI